MNKIYFAILAFSGSLAVGVSADTIPVAYSFIASPTKPPVMVGTTLVIDIFETGSILSTNPSLNAIWNPVTSVDICTLDLTTGLLTGSPTFTFADNSTLFGNLFEDLSKVDPATGSGPLTQTVTFTGGTGLFAGATGSLSGAGLGINSVFTLSGTGTIDAPAVPEPASAALLLGGLLIMLVALCRSERKITSV